MAALISVLGVYSYKSISSAGSVIEDTFDRPFMAVNYARSASQVFGQMELDIERKRSQIVTDGSQAPLYESSELKTLIETFETDLEIAKERSISEKASSYFENVDDLVDTWAFIALNPRAYKSSSHMARLDQISGEIQNALDIIVELQTDESFRIRESALAEAEKVKRYGLWSAMAALFLTILMSIWLAVTIIKPLNLAAQAARRISAGELDVEIPKGGSDETGALLNSMSRMQASIRGRMNAETDARDLAQTRLAESLENSEDAILLTDKNGMILVANRGVGEVFQSLNAVDLIGRSCEDFFCPLGKPLFAEAEYFEPEHELRFEDGRWLRINASDTQEGGRLLIWTDISEVKDRSEKLRVALVKARAADQAKSKFLAAMSHELKTPLNAVIGFSDIISHQALGEVGVPKYKEMAALISQSGYHLLGIVEDVLEISKGGDTSKLEATMTEINLIEIIEFCVATMASEAKEFGVKIIWNRTKTALWVSGDKLRLQQIFMNLLSNGIKFNSEGGAVRISVGALTGDAIRIDVVDNGIGVAAEDIDRITKPFEQVDNGNPRKYEGAGLGLSIVKQMAELHGGRISIQSKPGKGTCVAVVIPRLKSVAASPQRLSA